MPAKKKDSNVVSFQPTYHILLRNLSGRGLPIKDANGSSDPYVKIELTGTKLPVQTKVIENNLNPDWAEQYEFSGYAYGSDSIKFDIWDKDPIGGDDLMSSCEFFVREAPFGAIVRKELPCWKGKDNKPDKKQGKGAGGTFLFDIQVVKIGQAQWVEAPIPYRLYTAHVEFVNADNVPAADKKGTSDPFVVAKLEAMNDQGTKTKVQKATLNPVWNDKKAFLIDNPQTDKVKVILYDEDKPKDKKMAEGTLNLGEFQPDADWVDYALNLKGAKEFPAGATVNLRVKIECNNPDAPPPAEEPPAAEEPAAEPVPEPAPAEPAAVTDSAEKVVIIEEEVTTEKCQWKWGSYSTSYSTSFSGYSHYSARHDSEKLSDFKEGDEAWHNHIEVIITEKKTEVKVRKEKVGTEVLKGVVKGARGLIKADSDGTDSYVTVELIGKRKGKRKVDGRSEKVCDTSDPNWEYEFDLGEVRKGLAVEFIVWQDHQILGDKPIGIARYDVKNVEFDNPVPVEIELKRPPALSRLPKTFAGSWGHLLVAFTKTLRPNE